MKKVSVKRVLLIVMIGLICCVSTISRAGNPSDLLPKDGNNIIQNIEELPDNNQNISTPTPTTPSPTAPSNLVPAGTDASTGNTLPKTGVDDTIMWVLIAVSAVAAIYTYKKVRDYDV